MNLTNSTNIINTNDYSFGFIYTSSLMGIFVCFGIFKCLKNEYNDYKYGANLEV